MENQPAPFGTFPAAHFQVMKVAPIKDANGQPQFLLAAIAPTYDMAIQAAKDLKLPSYAIAANVIITFVEPTLLIVPKN